MGLVCLQPPLMEPVLLPELKEYCRIDAGDTSQDNNLLTLGYEARAHCEVVVRRCFVRQQWRLLLDFFPGYIDLKLAGTKVSSPFVSGSNAVLVGIRYAIAQPYPPVQSIDRFAYQNANGQTTSMITGPFDIASVSNVLGQPVSINTVQVHNLQSGQSITISGNAALLALLGQSSEVVAATGPNTLVFNGTNGTGAAIPGGGTLTAYNYVEDLMSNPARLAPVFGQMWPVARVVLNAVNVDFTVGYANPINVSTAVNSATITSNNYTFQLTDIGREISIPGAFAGGIALNTIVTGIGSPPSSATVREIPALAVTNTQSLIVNTPSAKPGHWPMFRRAIKMMVHDGYDNRLPRKEIEDRVLKMLYPARDLRM